MTELEKTVDNPQKFTMAELTQDEQFPDVQEHAIKAHVQKEAEEQAESVKLNKDGTPAKKRGRKPNGAKVALPESPNVKKEQENMQAQFEASANVVSGILEQLQVSMISEQFRYTDIERAQNILAWKTVLEKRNVKITPEMHLFFSHVEIIISRAQKPTPETLGKMEKAKLWIFNKVYKFNMRKKDKENALSDSGKNVIGEKHIREEKGQSVKGL